MPIVNGRMFAEVEGYCVTSNCLRVLVDLRTFTPEMLDFLKWIQTLNIYLASIKERNITIQLLSATTGKEDTKVTYSISQLKNSDDTSWDDSQFLDECSAHDIDLVASPAYGQCVQLASCNAYTMGYTDILRQCEIFVRGYDIAWSFSMPTWNAPLTGFYSVLEMTGRRATILFQELSQMSTNESAIETLRSLLTNNVHHVLYSKDKLEFYLQQRARAKRNSKSMHSFLSEIGYYQTQFYSSIWRGIDQLAVFLNSALEINFSEATRVGFHSRKFIRALKSKCPEIITLWQSDEISNWSKFMQDIRYYITHRGTAEVRPFVRERGKPPTVQEARDQFTSSQLYKDYSQIFDQTDLERIVELKIGEAMRKNLELYTDDAFYVHGFRPTQSFYTNVRGNLEHSLSRYEQCLFETLEIFKTTKS